jgi:hypothetical protein
VSTGIRVDRIDNGVGEVAHDVDDRDRHVETGVANALRDVLGDVSS